MAAKRTPEEVIADFLDAWGQRYDPALVEVTYRKGYYYIDRSEVGKRPEHQRLLLSYVPANWFEKPKACRASDLKRCAIRLRQTAAEYGRLRT